MLCILWNLNERKIISSLSSFKLSENKQIKGKPFQKCSCVLWKQFHWKEIPSLAREHSWKPPSCLAFPFFTLRNSPHFFICPWFRLSLKLLYQRLPFKITEVCAFLFCRLNPLKKRKTKDEFVSTKSNLTHTL